MPQDNAWIDKRVMIAWKDDVLKPYVAYAPDHVIPLLILDSYRCHMMASVQVNLAIPAIWFPSKIWLKKPQNLCQSCPHKIVVRAPWTNLASKNPLCFAC